MHEYEFRLVVEAPSSFLPLLKSLNYPIDEQIVYYMKPDFRFRNGRFETKHVESIHAIYHDEMWFRWVHSIETPYSCWSKSTLFKFLHRIGNYQQPLTAELRHIIVLDSKAKIYTFATPNRSHRLIFEWEYGVFSKPPELWKYDELLHSLNQYRHIYRLLQPFSHPPFNLNEEMTRKPVLSIVDLPTKGCLYARKLDGTFGLVFSYSDMIKEKWEGNECILKRGMSLGIGLVFAAEKLDGGEVCLLDVYQVMGHETAAWCRRQILTDFLRKLSLPKGYFVQNYVSDPKLLKGPVSFKTDGIIAHQVTDDSIFKLKTHHTIDLVYNKGYFYLPDGRFPSAEKNLEDGRVYEISIQNGRVLRLRKDRFKGNTSTQLKLIFNHGWHGPPIQPLPPIKQKSAKPKKKMFKPKK